jgi:hypothetical protein
MVETKQLRQVFDLPPLLNDLFLLLFDLCLLLFVGRNKFVTLFLAGFCRLE